jgi:hypothetical protein
MRFIFLNGPPRSGKDTACNAILSMQHPSRREMRRLSAPLKDAVAAIFGWSEPRRQHYERNKDTVPVGDTGLTYREWQIALSEKLLKPLAGPDVLGRLFLQHCLNHGMPDHVWVCPDAGFKEELQPILHVFKPDNVLIMHIVRPGTDFMHDSRSYIELEDVTSVMVMNVTNRHDFERNVARIAARWLGE